ncbi:host cell division inhibitor Icd-like protein [Salmonella enterica]|nr:host cell division inhibitor Icd-like protein [Salmonella enterica]ECJ5896151.1 host cell division inhibitor Icd-like protein [Salmonella enterica subsp. diarizonae]ECS3896876.1 host cell division inhibitor Icd-like protein [Salmonella enterica subsp. diarizonae serovar 48:i:z]EAM6407296.1 host cell division inhibitor Icd-like protein [Salmonella enterica]EAN2415025.1 host cell division inhibitor Icd-like protein [Salmonella enterica]
MATSRSVLCVADNFRPGGKELVDLYQYKLPEPAQAADEKNPLQTSHKPGYVYPASHKTGAGISPPKLLLATPDAASVFFVACYMRHSMAWCVIRQCSHNRRYVAFLAYHAAHNGVMCRSIRPVNEYIDKLSTHGTSRRPVMVALAGQPQGWPVSFLTGISAPVNITASQTAGSPGGDSLNERKEAAVMVATPTRTHPEFIFRFWSCQQSRYITSTATTEREARLQLPAIRLVFVARIRLEGVSHA